MASQIEPVNIHATGRSLICAMALGLPLAGGARADDATIPPASHAPPGCAQMMDQAMTMLLKMPAGVEKMAAQKELVSAKVDNDKGDAAGCRTHVNNAIGAMTAHNPD
ncbi:MAG TPA: hypothetical protein VHW25_09910 [Steroidobacteraceae bacterium]|jgi:hypothetical protein|nr:hypothetical protein [Steroidobacteraceae bacterium]